MSLDLVATAIGSRLIEWNAAPVADLVLQGVATPMPTSPLEKAIKASLMAAHRREKNLFSQAEKAPLHGLLDRFFKENLQVVQELQNALNNEQQPRVENLVAAFQQALEATPEAQVNQKIIEPWLRNFARAYHEETRNLIFHQIREEYLKQIIAHCETGVPESESSPSLSQIFIMPEVSEELPINEGSKLANRKFSIQYLLSRIGSHKLLILGAAGMGKTTFINYVSCSLANQENGWLPIVIYLEDLARYPESNFIDYLHDYAKNYLKVKQMSAGFFEYWLGQGKALILIEGAQQVGDLTQRLKPEYFEEFFTEYEHIPTLITARTEGNLRQLFPKLHPFSYRIQPFDSAKIHLFIKQWFQDAEKEEDLEKLQHRDILQQRLAEQKWLYELAKFPQLLTIIAQNHRYESPLPKKRHEICERLVNTLLNNWESLVKETSLTQEDLKRLMQQLAYEMQVKKSTLIPGEELLQELTKNLENLKQYSPLTAAAVAKKIVNFLPQCAGIFNAQSEGNYAFAHPRLQEYLAAEALRSSQQNQGWEILQEHLKTYLQDPHWQEVLLLAIAQQNPQEVAKTLEEILQEPGIYEQWLHQNLLFAGRCLAEGIAVADSSANQILSQLVTLEKSGSAQIGSKISAELFDIFSKIKRTEFANQLQQLLPATGEGIEAERLQKYRDPLIEIETAIAPLLGRLQDRDAGVRARAAKQLGKIGDASEWVIQALLGRFQDWDAGVRASAATAVGQLEATLEAVGSPLLNLLSDREAPVRASAALALGQVSHGSKSTLNPLLSLLGDRDVQVRASAVTALGRLGDASDAVLHPILSLLQDGEAQVRASAAEAVGWLGNGSQLLMEILLSVIQDRDPQVRASAVTALGCLGNTSQLVLQILLNLLGEDESFEVRSRAALALVKLGQPPHEVEAIVTAWMEQNPDAQGVGPLIDALWELSV